MNTNYSTFASAALAAAMQAGQAIMRVYDETSHDPEIEFKSDNTPLTAADKAAHSVISEMLHHTGIPVLSEEGLFPPYSVRKNWKRFWLADPLDGTKEFIDRNGEFTVNIALIEANRPVLGVIYAPVQRLLYLGIVSPATTGGQADNHGGPADNHGGPADNHGGPADNHGTTATGAWRLKNPPAGTTYETVVRRGTKLPEGPPPGRYTVVGSRSHRNPETRRFIDRLREQHGAVDSISVGSSLKLCMMAEGKAHIYPRMGRTMEWDTAAGQAIAEAAGKQVVSADRGTPLQYNKESLENPFFICR